MSDDDMIRRGDAVLAVTAADKECLGANCARDFIRALPAVQPTVKPLVWDDFAGRGAKAQAWNQANYLIQKWSDGRWEISASYPGHSNCADGIARFHPTIEAAKAAAQADYEARIRSALATQPSPDVTVWYGSMPESNGRANWTASLHRKGGDTHLDGFCFARSEYPDRVRYVADRVRWIIGELPEKPHILDYDADAHSGYAEPAQPSPDVAALVEALEKLVHAVCGETGFAQSVRDCSGFAYPWPALDEAELIARAAIARVKGGDA